VELLQTVRDAVKESHGIELRPEIRFVGSFV
jgi:UDP-N-acetylenolpyruvoylglucosamine reductase